MIERYKKSVEPVYTDGRDIDPNVGALLGEAASQQASGSSDEHIKGMARLWTTLPEPRAADPTYYDRPLLNEPVWKWAVPVYYYVGGLTGASLALGAATQLLGCEGDRRLVRRCHWIGFIGAGVSGVLLTFDLGRPRRTLAMFRVFRPTSPMNLGAWCLGGVGAVSTAALVLSGRGGALGRIGNALGVAAGVLGLALATYTGVLVGNTTVPVWQETRRLLPALFGASAIGSVGSFFELIESDSETRRIPTAFGTVGQVAESVAAVLMERQASVVPRVGAPFRRGLSGFMWRTAAVFTATSAVISFLPNRSRSKAITAGALGTIGALLTRMSIAHAGVISARDPRASFHQQRAGHGAAEVTGHAASVK